MSIAYNHKKNLESLYTRYNRRKYVYPDPLVFLYRYPRTEDREIAGLIASSLAFGNVKQIIGSVEKVLNIMGSSPRRYLLSASGREIELALDGFRHRWISCLEMKGLLCSIRRIIKKHGTVENCFGSKMEDDQLDIIPPLTALVEEMDWNCPRKSFLPHPGRGSACKRLNLFLRWMIRSDDVDPGGWNCASPSMLIVPLDTHMYRLSRKLGFTTRSGKDMETAIDITRSFSQLSPEDPVKYDFALTRLGIIGDSEMGQFEKNLETVNR